MIFLCSIQEKVNVLEALTRSCVNQIQLEHEPVNLCTTNRETQPLNAYHKSRISGENFIFKATVSGKFQERDYPTSAILELKIGARVMLLNNKRTPDGEFEYVNGYTGIVEDICNSFAPLVTILLCKKIKILVDTYCLHDKLKKTVFFSPMYLKKIDQAK